MRFVQAVTSRNPYHALDVGVVQRDALDQLAVHTFSWIIALRATWLSVDPAKRYDPPPFHLRPHEVEEERRTILLVIVIGLVVAPILQVGCLCTERHQVLEDLVVHCQLDNRPPPGVGAYDVAVLKKVMQ